MHRGRPGGEFQDADGTVGARDTKHAAVELDVLGRRFQCMAGKASAACFDLVGRMQQSAAGTDHGARPAGTGARHQFIAVALQQGKSLQRHTEAIGEHLREGHGMPLAVVQ